MTKRILYLLIAATFLISCSSSKTNKASMRTIDLFRDIITGDFDNKKQIDEEIKKGKQIHPFARHVNRIADSKIKNSPIIGNTYNGFFILEESYYEYPGKPVDIKPYLFLFTQADNNNVQLTVYQLPVNIDKKDIRNDNENLYFDFNELKLSTTFKGATYAFNASEQTFTTNAPNDLGNGMKFTLIETLSKTQLIVMELLEKDGKRVTAYDTPIIYDRK